MQCRAYAESKGEATRIFNAQELEYLHRAQVMVSRVPYELDGKVVRCHELARAVAYVLGLTIEDGYYGMVEHSWIWTTPREPFSPLPNILDPYAPGRYPQVQLVNPHPHLPFEYRRGDSRNEIDQSMVDNLIMVLTQ